VKTIVQFVGRVHAKTPSRNDGNSSMPTFTAKIYKIGINPVVDPPDDVLELLLARAGKSKGPIPVRGKINGAEFVQTLVKYQGASRLYINAIMLKASGAQVGDEVRIEIEFDQSPRDVPMPPSFAAALKKDRRARLEFEKLSPSRQKEILRYLGSLKTETSITKNIERVLKHLRGEPTDAQHALMRRSRT
jgi:hypothetical protein